MTATELQKRNEKSDHLRVLQTDSGQFFVESGEGKILYSVTINDAGDTCTCGDFAKNIKRDPDFKCKHILAVFNAVPKREVEGAVFLEKHVPELDERWITKIEGKEFVKYPGLLDLAHQHGLSSIEVDIVQMPTNDNGNFAVCRATVMSKIGETYHRHRRRQSQQLQQQGGQASITDGQHTIHCPSTSILYQRGDDCP